MHGAAEGPCGGGPPAEGPRGGGPPAEAPGGDRFGWGHIRQTMQSPDRQYKDPETLYKAPTDYTKPRQTIQSPKALYKSFQKKHAKPNKIDKNQNDLTRVANNNFST